MLPNRKRSTKHQPLVVGRAECTWTHRKAPAPVSDKEIDKILGNIKEGSLTPEPSLTFEIGEQVKVCEGPFASFSGLVEEVDEDKSKLKVSVSIFGRPTPIELEYNQVEKT